MTTITVAWDSQQQRHYVTGAVTDSGDYDSNSGIPEDIWDAGKRLIRRALADGKLLDQRGDRFEYNGYAIVVERVL